MTVPEVPSKIVPLTFWPGMEDAKYGSVFQPLLSIGDWAGGSSDQLYIQAAYVLLAGGYRYSTAKFDITPGRRNTMSRAHFAHLYVHSARDLSVACVLVSMSRLGSQPSRR